MHRLPRLFNVAQCPVLQPASPTVRLMLVDIVVCAVQQFHRPAQAVGSTPLFIHRRMVVQVLAVVDGGFLDSRIAASMASTARVRRRPPSIRSLLAQVGPRMPKVGQCVQISGMRSRRVGCGKRVSNSTANAAIKISFA